MSQYIVLTRVSPDALQTPEGLLDLEKQVKDRVSKECPDVRWKNNLAVMGPYDYLDIFEAPDNDTAMRVSAIIRSVGNASTELWPATDWSNFRDQVLK
ncbi:MAG: GYD domain-containing protein [Sphaerobacteraceae bacterium]|nr:MAG: GYD domain-containing protein [Sphaerobacteraceae bacterium]